MNNNASHIDRRSLASAEADLRKIVQLIILVDKSGSMVPRRAEIFAAIHQLLATLVEENLNNVDVLYRVRLSTFNDKITEITEAAFPPEDVAELFTEEDSKCSGFTGLAAVYDYLDRNFSRSSGGFLENMRPGDPLPVVLIATDMEESDAPAAIAAAREKLMKNRFFTASKRIVIFVGSSSLKKTAAADLVGGEENIISMTNLSLREFLSPMMISATLIQSDSTHISNRTTTPEETGNDLREKMEAGKSSQSRFRDKKLEKELEAFLSGKHTMTDAELEKAMEQYLAG